MILPPARQRCGLFTALVLCLSATAGATFAQSPQHRWWRGLEGDDALAVRGYIVDLEMYGGFGAQSAYKRQQRYEPNDRAAGHPFHDPAWQRQLINRLANLRLNTLVLRHPHPFPLFVDTGEFDPHAQWLSPEQLVRKREALTALLTLAAEQRVEVLLHTQNIVLPRAYAATKGIPPQGHDSAEARSYTQWCLTRMFQTYPQLAGLITRAGPTPRGCDAFVEHAVIGALDRLDHQPRLMLELAGLSHDQARRLSRGYSGRCILLTDWPGHMMTAQALLPVVNANAQILRSLPIGSISAAGATARVTMNANPQWIRAMMTRNSVKHRVQALLIEAGDAPVHWLEVAALARAAYAPGEQAPLDVYEEMLDERFGSRRLSVPLLAGIKAASLIQPTLLQLAYTDVPEFSIQAGMPLVQMLAMPSVSSHDPHTPVGKPVVLAGIDARPVVPIMQWAIAQDPQTDEDTRMARWISRRQRLGFFPRPMGEPHKTPADVAKELLNLHRQLKFYLPSLSDEHIRVVLNQRELIVLIRLLHANNHLAQHLAQKTRAAMHWARFVQSHDDTYARQCVAALEASIKQWREYARHTEAIYERGLTLTLALPPGRGPWSKADLAGHFVKRKARLSDVLVLWQRELEVVRDELDKAMSGIAAVPRLPTLQDLGVQ